MCISNQFIGVHNCLVRREIGLSSNKELQQAIEGQVIQNIAKDVFNSTEIITKPGSKLYGRISDFVAVKQDK